MKYMPGSVFRNAYIVGVAEIAGKLLGSPCLYYLGVKQLLALAYLLTMVGALGFALVDAEMAVVAASFFLLSTKFGLSLSFVGVYMGNYYIFPTLFASTAMGVCNVFSRVVTALSPMVAEIDEPIPIIIVIISAVIAFILSIALHTKQPKFT